MPSNYTQNYKLNQWEPEDQVRRVDFNADNAKIDGAISTVEKKADTLAVSKADQAALEAEIKARTSALATVNTALSRCGNCRIETFTYSGNGEVTRSVTFSARPVFFILAGPDCVVFSGGPGGYAATIFNMEGRSANQELKTSWIGNTVTLSGDNRGVANRSGNRYQAVAFFAQG